MAVTNCTELAIRDYMYLYDAIKYTANYSYIAITCHNIVVCLLKGILSHSFPDSADVAKLLSTTHNIMKLYEYALKACKSLNKFHEELRWLQSYATSTIYPAKGIGIGIITNEEICRLCTLTNDIIDWFFDSADFKLVYLTYKHLLNAKYDKMTNYLDSAKSRRQLKDLIGIQNLQKPLTGPRFYDTDVVDPDFNDD